MTVTPNDICQLRRCIAEPTVATYTDLELTSRIEKSALIDEDGHLPDDDAWIPTYDIYKVASEIWMEKASSVAHEFDFSADGGSFHRSQKLQMYLKQAGYYKSRSKAQSLQVKQRPLEHLGPNGWEDIFYKDDIDDYENDLK